MDSTKFQAVIYIADVGRRSPIRAEAVVLRTIGIVTPSRIPGSEVSNLRRRLLLADPTFDQPGRIDIVIGADVYHRVILAGTRRIGSLLAQNTTFGWILTGSTAILESSTSHTTRALATAVHVCDEGSHEKLLALVQRFWALEEVPSVRRISAADRECEALFTQGVRRTSDGRYTVRLPLKSEKKALLGSSLPHARSALVSMQRRMRSDLVLRDSYCQFMEEYEQLGHMRALTAEEIREDSGTVFYIPHHGIWQRSDGENKLRVVFNASRDTSTGLSLNDSLHSGPKLQGHIATIITRWRRHRYVFCADVQKMFRQILMDERDCHLQRIVWSPSSDLPAKHFVLRTVTYGTACAPYLALRTLQQLGEDEGHRFPLARELLKRDLYMDDFLSGSHDLETARSLRDQLIGLLRAGGFHLRKWVANEPGLLEDIPAEDRLRADWVQLSTDGPVCELGVIWDPVTDRFKFRPGVVDPPPSLTKRTALAELAAFFDPAGWLTPLTLVAKIIIQDL
ncbi:uncharacterized protein LOC131670408 [Phymastichus coffea]|uniref:uncharacterized protein LOC131670408 n=1 Tax=Phymastichus coffea TaxID=108790 RepID=UPI00273C9521|nr:uncharacterized protein LOC131670408 [Phymastichus coffea]